MTGRKEVPAHESKVKETVVNCNVIEMFNVRGVSTMKRLTLLALTICLALSMVSSAAVKREIWDGGRNIDEAIALAESGTPADQVDILDEPTWGPDIADNYSARMTGWLTVPETGEYTLYVAGDDYQRLYVSMDDNPGNAELVAYVDGWTAVQEWGKYDTQASAPMTLEAGQMLAFVGIMQEGGGGDGQDWGWIAPGSADIVVIPGDLFVAEHVPTALGKANMIAPADGATDVIDAILSWRLAIEDAEAPVYNLSFGTDPAALELIGEGIVEESVNVGTAGVELEYATTYYWQAERIGAAPEAVRSFTTEPFSFPIAGIVATTNGTSGPDVGGIEQTIDGSGIDENDGHSVESTDMWLAVAPEGEALAVEYAFDRVYKMDKMMVWNSNTGFEPFLGYGAKDVTVEYTVDGAAWMVLADVEVARAPGALSNPADTTVDFGGVGAMAVRLTINSNWGGLFPDSGLSEVRFMYIPGQARFQMPADGATGVAPDAVLSWQAGRDAVSHDVLIGVDELALAGTVEESSFAPELVYGMPYMWRVDENDGVDVWEGDVLSFTTAEFGAVVASQTLDYDNSVEPFVSEVEAVLDPAADLTAYAADTLSLSYTGNPLGYAEVDGVVTMGASGHDIWDNADDFRYAYKSLTGDGEMVARVDSIDNVVSTWAKAGVMIRQSNAAGSTHNLMAITSQDGNGASWQGRPEADGGSVNNDSPEPIGKPYYVKIVRAGDEFSGYTSPDGETWTQLGDTRTTVMEDPVLIGLAVTSHDSASSVVATFSEITTIGDVSEELTVEVIGDEAMPANDAAGLYLKIEDSAGAVATIQNADAGATQGASTNAWIIPLGSIEGVDLASVAKITVGAGDAAAPVAGGMGSVAIGAISVGTPMSHNVPADVTGPGDVIQGVPNDGDWPGAETPDLAIDNDSGTKYLHFKGETEPTGFQVTPASGATIVTELTLTSANDAVERDPVTFELYGSNDGIDGPYTLIAAGDVVDFAQADAIARFTMNTTPIVFENDVAYTSYQLLFPTVRDAGSANSMQIAEVELIGVVAP